jgi:hypothetical protein
MPLCKKIEWLKTAYSVKINRGAADELLHQAEQAIGELPVDLRQLLRITNGMSLNSFKLFPVFDPNDVKKTWKSLQRVNDPVATPYLAQDPALLRRFLVFSDVGGGDCAVIDRGDQSIWYEENGELHQTDLDVMRFVEVSLKGQTDWRP